MSLIVRPDDLKLCVEALPALAERTINYLWPSPNELYFLTPEFLDQVKGQCVREEILSAVENLFKGVMSNGDDNWDGCFDFRKWRYLLESCHQLYIILVFGVILYLLHPSSKYLRTHYSLICD